MESLASQFGALVSATGASVAAARLRGRALLFAHRAWLAIVAATVTLFVIGVPLHHASIHLVCAGVTCGGTQSPL